MRETCLIRLLSDGKDEVATTAAWRTGDGNAARGTLNEAVYTLYEGVGSVESIDVAMRLGANHPMGPLELADFIGLDTCLAVMHVLYEGLADSKYRPCPLLVKYVEAGWLGRKAGRGFYDYSTDTPVPTR